jgi:hypothetical protein
MGGGSEWKRKYINKTERNLINLYSLPKLYTIKNANDIVI